VRIQRKILVAIAERPMQFLELHGRVGLDEHFRVVDRELQKLRRAGVIAYDRAKRVWRIALDGK
jgi:hypothetical protein